jgi:hypothetical protein
LPLQMRWQTEGEMWDRNNQPLIGCFDDKSTKNKCSDINKRISGRELNVQASTVIKLPLNVDLCFVLLTNPPWLRFRFATTRTCTFF